ncbi:MAG: phenylalanine--tRNA ligase subunit beta, partial [Gammaproteobacteria bacterium]
GEGWQVTPPTFRFDIAIEADLIEEVARLHGYHRLPSILPKVPLEMLPVPEGRVMPDRIRACLNDRGYAEAITYSFIDPAWQSALDPGHPPLALQNPLSREMAVMRTSLLPGLLQAVLHNQRRQQPRLRLFETGAVFLEGEETRIGGVAAGSAYPEQWGMEKRAVDFFDVKGDVEALLALTRNAGAFRFVPGAHPALHPGKRAAIERDGEQVGWMGALHPELAEKFGLQGEIYAFELALEALERARLPHFRPFSRYPAIRRDIALLVDEGIPVASVVEAVREAAGELLSEVVLFDVYAGKGIPPGKKSLALGLILQHISRTLTDQEVDEVVAKAMTQLKDRFGAVLRGGDGSD